MYGGGTRRELSNVSTLGKRQDSRKYDSTLRKNTIWQARKLIHGGDGNNHFQSSIPGVLGRFLSAIKFSPTFWYLFPLKFLR